MAAGDAAPVSPLAIERQLPLPIDLSKLGLSAQSMLGFDASSMRVLEDAPLDATLAQVANSPEGAFRPFNPARTYALSPRKALWLHFRVMGQPNDSVKWSFELPKTHVDEVQFYYQNEAGQWLAQIAGKLTASTQWPMRGLFPRFELPPARATTQDVYVKVLQGLPIRADVHLKRLNDSNFELQRKLFLYGLVIGLLVLMSLLGLALAVAYRQTIYVWYSLYAAFACASGANYLGLANYFVMSESRQWAGSSLMIGIVTAAVIKLYFGWVVFSRDLVTRWVNPAVWVCVAMSLACIAGLLMLPYADVKERLVLFFIAFTTSTVMFLLVIGLAVYRGNKVALLWVLAFSPVTVMLFMTAAEGVGLVSLPLLPHDALVYARTFEVVVLLFAIQIHVKSLHAQLVRTRILADLDPLTGFVAALQYPDALAHLWSQARSNRQDMAVVYVRATVELDAYQVANHPADDEMVLRCVRMLRTVTRRDDTVARIGKNVFAVLMPGVSAGPNFANKLSRLIALGGMQDTDDVSHIPVKFRIVTTTFRRFSGTSGQLNAALWKKLDEMALTSDRAIEFVAN